MWHSRIVKNTMIISVFCKRDDLLSRLIILINRTGLLCAGMCQIFVLYTEPLSKSVILRFACLTVSQAIQLYTSHIQNNLFYKFFWWSSIALGRCSPLKICNICPFWLQLFCSLFLQGVWTRKYLRYMMSKVSHQTWRKPRYWAGKQLKKYRWLFLLLSKKNSLC